MFSLAIGLLRLSLRTASALLGDPLVGEVTRLRRDLEKALADNAQLERDKESYRLAMIEAEAAKAEAVRMGMEDRHFFKHGGRQ